MSRPLELEWPSVAAESLKGFQPVLEGQLSLLQNACRLLLPRRQIRTAHQPADLRVEALVLALPVNDFRRLPS